MSDNNPFRLRTHGYLGIALIIFAEISLILQYSYPVARDISIFTTPICWWGYIMLLDSIIYKLKNDSLMVNHKWLFLAQIFLSVVFWLIFEIYNLYLCNWKYIGLPENRIVTSLGMLLSFATIMPGMFFTAEILEILGLFKKIKIPPLKVSNTIKKSGYRTSRNNRIIFYD